MQLRDLYGLDIRTAWMGNLKTDTCGTEGRGRGELKDNFKMDINGIDYEDVRWINLAHNCIPWYALVLKFNLGLSCQRVGRKSTVSFIM